MFDRYVRNDTSTGNGTILIRQLDLLNVDIKEAIDAGADEAKAGPHVTDVIRAITMVGGKRHRNFGDAVDIAEMNETSRPGGRTRSNGGNDDNAARNLTRVHDGSEPIAVGDEDRKRNRAFNVDSGNAANTFGNAVSRFMKLLMTGGGSEANTSGDWNTPSSAVATRGGKDDRTDGCRMATVVNKCTTVAGRTAFNAAGEDVTVPRNDASKDGGMSVTKCDDEATLEIRVSNVVPMMAASTHGVDVAIPSNEATSVGPSSKIVLSSHKGANKACTTIGCRAHAEGPDAEYRADSNRTINGNGTAVRLAGVRDSFIRKSSSTLAGVSFSNFGDDDKTVRSDSSAGAGIKSNTHGDEDTRVMRATRNSDGRALSSDREPNTASKSVSTLSGTMQISDGDTECNAVSNVMIFAYGKTVNVSVIATIVFTNMGRGNPANRQGAAINTSIKFSTPVGVKPLTASHDFSGFNNTVYTDMGIEHNVDGATADSVRRNRINGYVGTDVAVSASLYDIRVIRFTTAPGFRRHKADGDTDKASNKSATVRRSRADNKHGHLEMAVVSSLIVSELKPLNVSAESNESVIARIAFGDSEQNIDGDSAHTLPTSLTNFSIGKALETVDEAAIDSSRTFKASVDNCVKK